MTEEYCKEASQEELISYFGILSKDLIKKFKIKEKSSLKELNTKCKNKKQMDSLYAKSFNDHKSFYKTFKNLQIVLKYII
jgi:hypothetical protein